MLNALIKEVPASERLILIEDAPEIRLQHKNAVGLIATRGGNGEAVEGARRHGRPVGVCGGLASDLAAAPILIGLGVTELSATSAMTPELKALVRTLTMTDCADLARQALAQTSAAAVRALAPARPPAPALGRGAA